MDSLMHSEMDSLTVSVMDSEMQSVMDSEMVSVRDSEMVSVRDSECWDSNAHRMHSSSSKYPAGLLRCFMSHQSYWSF